MLTGTSAFCYLHMESIARTWPTAKRRVWQVSDEETISEEIAHSRSKARRPVWRISITVAIAASLVNIRLCRKLFGWL